MVLTDTPASSLYRPDQYVATAYPSGQSSASRVRGMCVSPAGALPGMLVGRLAARPAGLVVWAWEPAVTAIGIIMSNATSLRMFSLSVMQAIAVPVGRGPASAKAGTARPTSYSLACLPRIWAMICIAMMHTHVPFHSISHHGRHHAPV